LGAAPAGLRAGFGFVIASAAAFGAMGTIRRGKAATASRMEMRTALTARAGRSHRRSMRFPARMARER